MTIKIFKNDEPTFDIGRLMAEDIWRVYVTDYLGTGPTHGSPIELVSIPVMKRNVRVLSQNGAIDPHRPTNSEGDDAEGGASNRRFDLVRAKEALEFKIAVENLGLHFNRSSEEYFHQAPRVRSGGKDGAVEAEATAKHRYSEWPRSMQVAGEKPSHEDKARDERAEFFKDLKGEVLGPDADAPGE